MHKKGSNKTSVNHRHPRKQSQQVHLQVSHSNGYTQNVTSVKAVNGTIDNASVPTPGNVEGIEKGQWQPSHDQLEIPGSNFEENKYAQATHNYLAGHLSFGYKGYQH